MASLIKLFLYLIYFGMIYFLIKLIIGIAKTPKSQNNNKQNTEENLQTDYRPKQLLTNYEQINYQKMKMYAAAHGLTICPKIRLADLIEPKPVDNRAVWQKRFNMICSKHIDFAFCDPDMNVKLIVELDDRSHNRKDRQARDQFVDVVLRNSGYTIVHIHAFDEVGLAKIDSVLGPVTPEAIPEKTEIKVKLERNFPTYEEWKEQQLAQNDPG